MPWNPIASSTLAGNALDLYESDGVYMVRVGGLELMNGHWHESEDALGRLAFQFARATLPRILLGGLGLGYSLAGLSAEMGVAGHVTVAEISGAIIDWFGRFMQPILFEQLPANVTIVRTDVSDLLRSGQAFDVIALDVDNGPEPLSAPGNTFLYAEDGLRAMAHCLGENGVLLVWSGFESLAFVSRGEAAGFHVRCVPVSFARKPHVRHHVYVLSRAPFTVEESERIDRP